VGTAILGLGMAAGSSNDRQLARSRWKCKFCYSYSCSSVTGVSLLSCPMLLMLKWVRWRSYSV